MKLARTQAWWARLALAIVQIHKAERDSSKKLAIATAAAAVQRVGNHFVSVEAPSACEACGGCGVLFDTQSAHAGTMAVERCDSCKVYESDQEAMADVEALFTGGT